MGTVVKCPSGSWLQFSLVIWTRLRPACVCVSKGRLVRKGTRAFGRTEIKISSALSWGYCHPNPSFCTHIYIYQPTMSTPLFTFVGYGWCSILDLRFQYPKGGIRIFEERYLCSYSWNAIDGLSFEERWTESYS